MSKTNTDIPVLGVSLGIAAVERETGLSKDLLRVWERRYGFPAPERDAVGERLYPPEQVQRLRWIKRLLDAGHRPSHVVALPAEALQARLREQSAPQPGFLRGSPNGPSADQLDALLEPLFGHELYRLHEQLQAELLRRGLSAYVTELLAPLIHRVGQLWSENRLQVFEEHLFTEAVQQQLRRAIAMLPGRPREDRPRVLLTTLPGEEHGLGLLMAQSLMTLEGCHCVSLGLQTPIGDLAEAVRVQRADVLGLSFSAFSSAAQVDDGLGTLLPLLPEGVELWVGGNAAALRRAGARWPNQLRLLGELGVIASEVSRWRSRGPQPQASPQPLSA